MIRPVLFQSPARFSLILICAMLGACATTQRSSTGSGDQAPAPISDANPQTAAKSGDLPGASSSFGTTGASSPSNSAKSAGAAGASSGNTGTRQGSSEGSATDDAAQLKRQLADQDAQINQLRNDQQAGNEREEVEAMQMREEQAAATAGARDPQLASSGAASATRSEPQDETAVFPANANVADSGGAEDRESAAAGALQRSVYFDYNQASVADRYDAMLLANAAYLKAHPRVKAEVQGNCDARGSREYNLALGARRAQAVKLALELAGVDGSHISVISYGAEKPVASGKDEESYSQNRRVDIFY